MLYRVRLWFQVCVEARLVVKEMPEDAMVSLRMADGTPSSRSLWQVKAPQVIEGVPWRATRSVRGQAHFPGFFWSATMSGHVIYESRLELARLLLADFDRGVAAIAAQPSFCRRRWAEGHAGTSRTSCSFTATGRSGW
jgi:hypothetical protein